MLGHGPAVMTFDVYGHLWETGLDTLPGTLTDYMALEREKKRPGRRTGLSGARGADTSVRWGMQRVNLEKVNPYRTVSVGVLRQGGLG